MRYCDVGTVEAVASSPQGAILVVSIARMTTSPPPGSASKDSRECVVLQEWVVGDGHIELLPVELLPVELLPVEDG